MTPVEGLPPHGMTKPREGASGSCHRTDPNRPTGSQPGGQSLRRGLPSPSGGRWALSRGDSQSPVAERPGAARRPVRAPPRDDYVIPAPSPEARTGTCADNTNAPSTDQQPAWLLTPRRGAVCRVSGAGTLITSAPPSGEKGARQALGPLLQGPSATWPLPACPRLVDGATRLFDQRSASLYRPRVLGMRPTATCRYPCDRSIAALRTSRVTDVQELVLS